jgi:alpha-D-xyloside xylohydrolase
VPGCPIRRVFATDGLQESNRAEAWTVKFFILCAAALLLGQFSVGLSQTVPRDASTRAAEPRLEALVRADNSALALTLPGKNPPLNNLLLHGFEFNGDAVSTDKLHLKELAPGVFEVTSIAYDVGEWRVRIRDAGDYYGLGERSDTLNHARTLVHNLQRAGSAGAKGSSTSKPVPFFMSATGYGIWFDTTGDATFDLNATSSAEIIVDCDAEKLRIVLFTGPEFPKILEAFTAQEGRPVLPPSWAFAPWLPPSAASKARQLGLPGSVVVQDTPSPAPGGAKRLDEQGYKLVVPVTSFIAAKSAEYTESTASGFFVKSADGSPYLIAPDGGTTGSLIDFTNARAKLWWQQRLRAAVQAGADGFETRDVEETFPEDAKFADGSDPRLQRNGYGVLLHKAAEEVLQTDMKGDGVLLSRAATSGDNGLGFLRGDPSEPSFSPENGLSTAVTAALNAGMSGMPLWIADPAGAPGSATPDSRSFMRWTEFAAFSPVMLAAPSPARMPWVSEDEPVAVYRKFSTLHMALFPYRYAAAQEAAKTGMPLTRALALPYQDDAKARQARYEYLFGPDLLVAPIVDEGTQRTVYLPAGGWLDYWTGKPVAGGQTVVAEAARDSIPVYVRAGAVIPMLPDDIMTLVPTSESGTKTLQRMDDRRVYELFGEAATATAPTTDFEGRVIARSGNKLTITGDSAAHIILRWRFQKVEQATVDGSAIKVESDDKGPFIEFDHLKQTEITWR